MIAARLDEDISCQTIGPPNPICVPLGRIPPPVDTPANASGQSYKKPKCGNLGSPQAADPGSQARHFERRRCGNNKTAEVASAVGRPERCASRLEFDGGGISQKSLKVTRRGLCRCCNWTVAGWQGVGESKLEVEGGSGSWLCRWCNWSDGSRSAGG